MEKKLYQKQIKGDSSWINISRLDLIKELKKEYKDFELILNMLEWGRTVATNNGIYRQLKN